MNILLNIRMMINQEKGKEVREYKEKGGYSA